MRKALVCGATGQTGSYMVDLLLEKGYAVYCLLRRTSSGSSRLTHVSDRVEFVSGDLTDSPSLEAAIQQVDPDEVYNFAAQSHVGVSFIQPLHTADVTGVGALRLFEALRLKGKRGVRVFQASSSEMFGNAPPPQSEQTPLLPVSPYGCAKVFAHLCAQMYRIGYGLHISCGISFNHESPRRGEEFVTRKITQAIAGIARKERQIVRLGSLHTKRDWMHAKDVAQGAWLMLQQETPDDYVLASGVSHTVGEFADAAFLAAGLNPSNHIILDAALVRPTDPSDLCGDASKAHRLLGWWPLISFEALIREMVTHDCGHYTPSDFPRHS